MIVITINTEDGNKVSFLETQNGSVVGEIMNFDSFDEVKDVTIGDVFDFKHGTDGLLTVPFGEVHVGKSLLFEIFVKPKRKEEFKNKFMKLFPEVFGF